MPQIPTVYTDIILKLLLSLLTLILTLIANRTLRNMLKVRIGDPTHLHTLYMLTRNAIYAA